MVLRFPHAITRLSSTLIFNLSLGLGLSLALLTDHAWAVQAVQGLLTPESVVQAADGKIYVSEINGFGVDGDGQIRVLDGERSSVLISGLDDPKGLALSGQTLLVADKTRILAISLNTQPAKASVLVHAKDFPQTPQFLNDLAIDAGGNLYVSDSGDILGSGRGGAVYKITPGGKPHLLINGAQDDRILAPNGLLVDATGAQLMLVDFTSGVLYQLDLQSGQLKEIANGFGGGDGIVKTAKGHIYVSDWKNGKVYRVEQTHAVLVQSGYQSAADIALSIDGQHLLVPDMKAGILDTLHIR